MLTLVVSLRESKSMDEYFIHSFQSIKPRHIVSQNECIDWIVKMHSLSESNPSFSKELQEKIESIGLGSEKIAMRGVQMSDLFQEKPEKMENYNPELLKHGGGLKKKMDFFEQEGFSVFEKIYSDTELPNHIVHVSCTGYVSPSPAQKIVSKKQSDNTIVTHSYHMGCYGAFPALRIAMHSKEKSDIVHTEFCTLHMNPYNHSKEQLVIESLFADGFIKYSIDAAYQKQSLRIIGLHEIIIPDSTESMKWNCEDWGFGMRLGKDVPVKIARYLDKYLERICEKTKLSQEDILKNALFAIHPGGPKIIDQIQDRLKLTDEQVFHSKKILRSHGNMSSATLPHIWQDIIADESIATDRLV
ncbi:MAG: naringenin-chalcone synthase, partial [Chlamydiae bacterium]|nr:naringenin-chalcone synthase [Chlamydiota bacterium]